MPITTIGFFDNLARPGRESSKSFFQFYFSVLFLGSLVMCRIFFRVSRLQHDSPGLDC